MHAIELQKRIVEAQTRDPSDMNCIGFVLFALGVLMVEKPLSGIAYRIKKNLEVISRDATAISAIPSEADAIGF